MTGSERFLADFEKMTIFRFFENVQQNYENCQKSLKSDISDTNGYRKRDFRLETSQNDTLKVDFRPTGTHFMTFSCFFFSVTFFLVFGNRRTLMSRGHM